ncbi:MAG: SH3 domain-containing protein [Chloroflexota bacterium]
MKKPLVALSLAVTAGVGAIPLADALAATPASLSQVGSKPNRSSTRGVVAQPYSYPGSSSSRGPNAVSGSSIVQTAMQYLGYPYTATGNSPSTGFSCIGFVSYVYRSNGIPLPGDLGSALAYAPQVPFSQLQPGDILYFQNTVWNGLSHAAIYIGGGKFIHAEWYNRGVVISSFNNDPVDGGTYWISKYLGANRPWGGAAIGSIVGPAPVPGAPPAPPGTITQVGARVTSGPTAIVTALSLNVRSHPSKQSMVQQIVGRGSSMTILKRRGRWYKVQLGDGTVGWVVAAGIGRGVVKTTVTTSFPGASSVGPATTIGAVSTPSHLRSPYRRRAVASIRVSGLRVHTGPSTSASVVTTAARGQHLQVMARRNGWIRVRMPDGTVGWVSGAYASVARHTTARVPHFAGGGLHSVIAGPTARVAMNVRSIPSRGGSIASVIMPGITYRVLGWSSNGWMHVQLSDGTTGWVSGTLVGHFGSATSARYHTRPRYAGGSGGSVLTAGVRVHTRPGLHTPVITLAGAGTHVRVLGYSRGWARVRLPNGTTGYVSGAYVR